jgi:hypothetical protein
LQLILTLKLAGEFILKHLKSIHWNEAYFFHLVLNKANLWHSPFI